MMNKEQPAKSPRKPVLEQVKQLIILTRTSLFLNHLETSTEVAELVCQQIKAIIGQGYVVLTLLNELTQTFSVSATGGFENDNLIKAGLTLTGTDPTKIQVPAKDLPPEDLTNYQSGRLELLEDNLYALLIRKYPRTTCSVIGRLFSIRNVYTIGFAHRGQHIGGIAILTDSRDAVEINKFAIENITIQAEVILNRLYVEKKLAKREGNYSEILEQSQDGTLVTDERGNIEIWNEGMDK